MDESHQIFVIVRCPTPGTTDDAQAHLVDPNPAAPPAQDDSPPPIGDGAQPRIPLPPPQAPYVYMTVSVTDAPLTSSLSAVQRLSNTLTALSHPSHRRAIFAEIKHARRLGPVGIWESKHTPCPYISNLVFAHTSFVPETGTTHVIRAEKHTVKFQQLWDQRSIAVIDITDVERGRVRYAYVDTKPEGRLPYMTPVGAGRYLAAYDEVDGGWLLDGWEVLEVYTLDSAFPGNFDEESVGVYDPEDILRDPWDDVKDAEDRRVFCGLEERVEVTNEFPTLQLLAVKGTLERACADEDSATWLKEAVHHAPTTMPIVRELLTVPTPLSNGLYETKGFGRVLAVLIPELAPEDDMRKGHLNVTPCEQTEQNLTEFLSAISTHGPYNSVDLSHQENLSDEHLSLLSTAFPVLKTVYLINTPNITITGISAFVCACKHPPRVISTAINTAFMPRPDAPSHPHTVLNPTLRWPGYATQVIWNSHRDPNAGVCHAGLIHPSDVLVGVYNLVAAYANRLGDFERRWCSHTAISGAFNGVRDSVFPGISTGWLLEHGVGPHVRHNPGSPQYNMDNMDDALGKGEWRVYIRTRSISSTENEGKWKLCDPKKKGRAVAFAFFRAATDDDTTRAKIKIDALEDIPADPDELTEEQKDKLSPRELLEYNISRLTKLTRELELRDAAVSASIAASKQRIADAKAQGFTPEKKIKYEGRGSKRRMEQHTLRSFIDVTLGSEVGGELYDAIMGYTPKPVEKGGRAYVQYEGEFRVEEMDENCTVAEMGWSGDDRGGRGVETPPGFV